MNQVKCNQLRQITKKVLKRAYKIIGKSLLLSMVKEHTGFLSLLAK